MKFTAVIPVTKVETKTYDINISEDSQRVLKAYEKWYYAMTKENKAMADLINTIKVIKPDFDEKVNDFWEYVDDIIDNILREIYKRESICGNAEVNGIDDVHALADGNFNFL